MVRTRHETPKKGIQENLKMTISQRITKLLRLVLLGCACSSVVESFQTLSTSLSYRSNAIIARHNSASPSLCNRKSFLIQAAADDGYADRKFQVDSLVRETSTLTRRLSWFSWWAQLILTTVSSVTLVFARNVIRQSHPSIAEANSLPNFLLAGSAIVFSCISIFWTWASRRLARRLLRKPTSKIQTANMLRKTIDFGVTVNVIGMFFTIIGAEQIVGALAIKALTTSRAVSLTMDSNALLQPLDILVVQANTNTLFSHFASLVSLLYLSRQLRKLDPPSVEFDERRR